MKIIVSHEGKQHVNALLTGLWKHGVLAHFFTSLATNKFTPPQYIGEKGRAKLKKRFFTDIDSRIISHFPFIALVSMIVKSEYAHVFYPYRWFDALVARQLRQMDFDILIGYENNNLLSFREAKRRGKITVLDLAAVHHRFQNPVLIDSGTYTADEKLERICARKDAALDSTDYVLALSNFAEMTLVKSGFPAERIYKTYLGINQSVFKPKNQYRTEGVFELYFVGTMMLRKATPFLLEVHKALIDKGLNIRLTLIGPIDDFTPPAEETPQYRYLPFIPHTELVKLHHSLDLFVFPSNIDSWAQVVVEAMACGTPVLVSENTGAKDAAAKGGGRVLPIGDLAAWTAAIEQFYHNRSLLETMGRQAAAVAQTFTWEAYHEQVYAAMTSIYKRNLKASEPFILNSLERTDPFQFAKNEPSKSPA
jgi:glycosyltransferase involved in cell wall biosynthesis